MKLCDYGCGQEAKYQFKNGKWCCSEFYQSCPSQQEKKSTYIKEIWKDPNSGLNSISCKEKKSKSIKKLHKDPNSSYNSKSYREKKSNIMIEALKDPNSGLNSISCKEKRNNGIKDAWKDPNSRLNSIEYREKKSNIMIEAWKDPDSKYNSISSKAKKSNNVKEFWNDPSSIFNSKSYREKKSNIMIEAWADPNSGLNSISKETRSNNTKEAWADPNSGLNSISCKEKKIESLNITIGKINTKYPFFSKIEEMRYNPDKPDEKEIQAHCKNYECENSKEKGGWFIPSKSQLSERIQALENPRGFGESNFYCSQYCKDTCILFGLHGDPYKENNKPYTSSELDVFNKLVLKRDNEICYYCKKHHANIVHHLRPQKLEPFFALDPDYAISVCKKCHYKYGHPTGSEHSTGNLAKIVCSVESQKFLNQKLK